LFEHNGVEEIIETVKRLEPTFGGINLEDISAPRCFEIEQRLKAECNIPVFHDDQHGTAIVTAAGLVKALKLVNKTMDEICVVVNGAGAAGVSITKLFHKMGVNDILLCDTKGIIYKDRPVGMNKIKDEVARFTNKEQKQGTLVDAVKNADVL
jgi:malate dehydrogenase (oxaloacetate-decarboxylating)